MKNIFRNKNKNKISPVVMRAIARLNKHQYEKVPSSVVWNGRSITQNLSITS
jgi:hypothetical protein|tara:strand:+ start:765 stop:920 length:156 start_codon:yes stop_codon:yes gene_type:complete